MKIAMAAAEAAPFLKTGGLGDVMEALPQALAEQKNMEICLFLPYYKAIKQNENIPVEQVCKFTMQLGWRQSYVGVLKLKSPRRKLRVYFIDNNDYFWRDTVYGCVDDGERFAFYSKAVLEAMDHMDFRPEILHCHDWQASLVPLLYHSTYEDRFPGMKTVLTIHNLEYQGWANPDFLGNPATDSLYFRQTLRLSFHNSEGVITEFFYDTFCQCRAYAFNSAGSQITFHAHSIFRSNHLMRRNLKL